MTSDALRAEIVDGLSSLSTDDLRQIADLLRSLQDAHENEDALTKAIRSLPRLITDHPILVWGWDPCDDNDIYEVWFGPTTVKMSGIRRGYPQFPGLDRYESRPLLALKVTDNTLTLIEEDVSALAVDVSELVALERATRGHSMWPHWYDQTTKSTIPVDLSTADDRDELHVLDEFVSEHLSEPLSAVAAFVQDQIRTRGMRLRANHPDVSFTFNRAEGTIDLLNSDNILPLLSREPTQPPSHDGQLVLHSLGAEMAGQDFSGADLRGLYLEEADFKGADLSNADLSGSYLHWAQFDNANLSGANVSGACLSKTSLDRAASLDGLIHDDKTVWPEGFTPAD